MENLTSGGVGGNPILRTPFLEMASIPPLSPPFSLLFLRVWDAEVLEGGDGGREIRACVERERHAVREEGRICSTNSV